MHFLLEGFGVFFLFLIACIFLAILVLIVILILMLRSIPSINALNQEISDYIEQIVRIITIRWEFQELAKNATPKLVDLLEPNQLSMYSEQCEKDLGQLTLYGVARGSVQGLPVLNFLKPFLKLMAKKADLEASENLTLAEFISESNFEKGSAKFDFQLLNREEGWLVNSLTIIVTSPNISEPRILVFGKKTTMAELVEENKRAIELENLYSS